ncbi:quinohemoprotein amine dehydrogenase subunit alpha [Herminiimonas sp. CN]|uniref:quinohemoprotein amine dehydrogenase subunit alpha n=1 Tax=Herminiimonas sp. CN TaxID=1349818 RepID=UPI00138E2F81|nr:quinohemoprotein amine dehydrogenase subunit alpha [Herminiimonas sp. CN]
MLLDAMKMLIGRKARWLRRGLMTIAGLLLTGGVLAAPISAPDILKNKCGGCHLEGGKLQRIPDLRKTPEGWDMSIARMQVWHKVEISREERQSLVKYLTDQQGLAPEEAAPYRFLIERRPNVQDVVPSEKLGQMCARCHSFGRVALQRRDVGEWKNLIHTHLGQFPSIEYSALGRDRNWKDIALNQVALELAGLYPANTAAWKSWQNKKHALPTGSWRIAGHRPGWGDYAGYMQVDALGSDRYDVRYELNYAAGNRVRGHGQSIIYSGYEWRGDATLGNEKVRTVLALSEDGKKLSGRWFLRETDEVGATFEAVQAGVGSRPSIIAVFPSLLKAGSETLLSVHGVQLGKDYDLGPGIRVLSAKQKNAGEVELMVSVADDAAVGLRNLRAKGGTDDVKVAVYRQFDSIRVEPEFGIARLGGGTNLGMSAQFEAIAYLNGADGIPGTADDVRLGWVPANWSVDNYDEKAKADDDVRFTGVMEQSGLYIPAVAGSNPARKGMNNTGNLSVIAKVADQARTSEARGHLIVTVQRWNKPSLR